MKIAVVVDARIAVPPPGYGGIERVAHLLAEGLQARGHDITLFASRRSTTSAKLWGYYWSGKRPRIVRALIKAHYYLLTTISLLKRPDVVIAMCRPDYLTLYKHLGIPIVYNFQNPVEECDLKMLRGGMKTAYRLVGLSRSQIGKHFDDTWAVIPNAVDVTRLSDFGGNGGYLAFLGRLTYNKGVDVAISAATRTRHKLKIAGNKVPDESEYFEHEVSPFLGEAVEWVGEIGDSSKAEFLGRAKALLFPIRWEEPFGIVMAEALACGTPVIAFPRGSVSEVVLDGINGFVVADVAELIDAIGRIEDIDRNECRSDAVARFSAERLVLAYEAVCRDVIESSKQ